MLFLNEEATIHFEEADGPAARLNDKKA